MPKVIHIDAEEGLMKFAIIPEGDAVEQVSAIKDILGSEDIMATSIRRDGLACFFKADQKAKPGNKGFSERFTVIARNIPSIVIGSAVLASGDKQGNFVDVRLHPDYLNVQWLVAEEEE